MDYRHMRAGFRSRLENAGRRLGFTVERRKETQLALSGALNCLIYFKVRSQQSPSASTALWGVTKTYIEEFRKSRINWTLVLLLGSADRGYFLAPSQVERHVRQGMWPLAEDGDYKVASSRLRYDRPFESFDEFTDLLIGSVGLSEAEPVARVLTQRRGKVSEEEFWERQVGRREASRRGEECIVEVEREALRKLGRKDLAGKVERVSPYDVGAGYDVLSFYPDGREKYIEVKASSGRMTTFEITAKEKAVAEECGEAYWLYLVQNLEDAPAVTTIQSPGQMFGKQILLEPSAYIARLS